MPVVPESGASAMAALFETAPAPDEFCPIRFNLDRSGFVAFDDSDMGGPNLGIAGSAAAPGGDDDTQFGQVVGHHEHLGKCRMGLIC